MQNAVPQSVDVLVVGGGPTGLTLANLLGTMGVRTALVERNETTVQEPRAVSIDDESMRTMQAAGVAEAVQAITVRGYGSIYKGPGGKVFATVKPISREYGFDKRNAFQQPELESLLRDKLDRFNNVTALFGMTVTNFTETPDAVMVELADRFGDTSRITARYMVACDGGRSPTRKSLGIELEGSTFEEPWLIVDLARTFNRGFHTEVSCKAARPTISLPGPKGIRRYEFMLHKGEDPEAAIQEPFVRDLLAAAGPDRDAPFKRVQVYTFHARIAKRWRQGRVFLAGDAAHLTPPFAGQGMNSGLRDAHNLAWKLAEAVRGGDAAALLDSYETERKPHAWSMIQLALRMGQIMMPRSSLQGAATRAAFHLLGLYPPARDYFAQMRYKPKPRFKAGMIWTKGPERTRAIIGRMLPQPEVATVEGRRLMLDAILPDKPVILLFHEKPDAAISANTLAMLRRAGADVIGITPEWMNPAEAAFPIVRDASRLLSEPPYISALGHALLLRRDRYVAAACPISQTLSLMEPLKALCPAGAGGIGRLVAPENPPKPLSVQARDAS
jgi:3-(3-hydroxy-phenyl)propionate hydroxylase